MSLDTDPFDPPDGEEPAISEDVEGPSPTSKRIRILLLVLSVFGCLIFRSHPIGDAFLLATIGISVQMMGGFFSSDG